ncbi:MAG: asparagine synthetase B, partial [Bacteroidota bacterium]|nr:asparagine synthetase B [Bacteroidota bacterium]
MDKTQKNHLKAYGLTYWSLSQNSEVDWLLNYRGGSFLLEGFTQIEKECKLRNISYQVISDDDVRRLKVELANPSINAEIVKLLKPPKIAVYSPKTAQPWDDAVTLVLSYAEIP